MMLAAFIFSCTQKLCRLQQHATKTGYFSKNKKKVKVAVVVGLLP
jgi:hypothetical protein